MNPIDLIGGFYTVDGLSWACQDTVNYLPTKAEAAGTKTPAMLKTPPGLKPYVNIGDAPSFAIRGMHDVEGALFVVSGRKLYQISNKGVAIPIGTIPGVSRVSMAHNQITGGNELLVVNGTAGYVYNTVTQVFERVTDEGYPGSFLADYIDSYLMQVEPFGRFLFHSNLADASDYNTLDRFEAETYPDKVVSMLVDHQEVWAFGERSIDLFENSGSATGTFIAKGISIEQGCAGRFTPAKLDNSVFWLGNDGIVYRANGYSPVRISTHAIEDAIADCDWSQAFAFTWSSKGHKVYYLTFPDGQTWGFDVSSGLWHRRSTYTPAFEVSRRWRLNDLVYSNGRWIGGDSLSGKLYILDWDYMLDDQDALVSERVSPIVYNAGSRFTVDAVELLMRTGEKPTTASEFPVQPPSPIIEGDAPDGVEGAVYGPYSYALSGGTPPYTVTLRPGSTMPPGLPTLTSAGTIPTGTPTEMGSYTIIPRVTDSNGMWDELTDEINIGVGPLLARGFLVEGGSPYTMSSSLGTSWATPISGANIGSIDRLFGVAAFRFLGVSGGSTGARYTDDLGVNWEITTLSTAAQNYSGAVTLTGVTLVSGTAGINRSIDNAATWSVVGPSASFSVIAGHNDLVVALSDSRPSYTTDKGVTWSSLGVRLDTVLTPPLSFQFVGTSDGERVMFGGSSGFAPVIAYTDDGVSFTSKQVSAISAYVTALAFGKIGDDEIWLAGMSTGAIYRSVNKGLNWTLCTSSLTVPVNDIMFNGVLFIAGGGLTGTTQMKTSADGDAFTLRSQAMTYSINSIAQGRA